VRLILGLLTCFLSTHLLAANSLSYSGRLVHSNGSAVTGPVNLKFELSYTNLTSMILCSEDIASVSLSNGVFHTKLNLNCSPKTLNEVLAQIPSGESVAIRVTDVTNGKIYSFQSLHSVPFANVSEQIAQLGATSGQVLSWNGNSWVPITPTEITSATPEGPAGGALTGNYPNPSLAPVSQANVINLVSDLASKIGLTHLSATAPLVYDNTSGVFSIPPATTVNSGTMSSTDKAKLDTLESMPSSEGVVERFGGVLRTNTCTSGQVLKWNSVSGWTCSSDDSTDSTKLPLTGGTLTGELLIDSQLSLKNGSSPNYVSIKTSPIGVTPYTLTLPTSAGSNNQILTTDGSGVLSWSTPASNTAPSGPAGGALTGNYPDPGLAPISSSLVIGLDTALSSKIGLSNLSASLPLVYDNGTGAFSISAATTGAAGAMSASDKLKLDGLETFPASDGIIERVGGALASKTCSDGKIIKWIDGSGWICSDDDHTDPTKLPLSGGALSGDLFLNTKLNLKNGGALNYVTIQASPTGVAPYTLVLPETAGGINQVLTTDGSGVLSWKTPASSLAPSGPAGGALTGTYPDPGLAPIAQSNVIDLETDLAQKLELTSLSASAPLSYNNTTGAFSISAANTGAAGSMSAGDKTKLDGLEAFPVGNGLIERFGGSLRANTCTDGKTLKWNSVSGWSCADDNATDNNKWTINGTDIHTVNSGNVGIGTTTPAVSLDLSQRTDGIALPSGTDAQQPIMPPPGTIRFNSTNSVLEFFNGDSWLQVVGGGSAVNPAGLIGPFPMAVCPSGWLEANGSAISRTSYASLFSAIGTSYGSGDGSSTFNLPDYRGYFLRGWDNGSGADPDAASRTDRGDGTTGDFVGTKQVGQIQSHTHSESSFGNAAPNQFWINSGSAYGANYTTNTGASGGNETRPKNISVIYCVSTATNTATTVASSGSGTANTIPVWTDSQTLGSSPLSVDGSNVVVSGGVKFPDGSVQTSASNVRWTSTGLVELGTVLLNTTAEQAFNLPAAVLTGTEIKIYLRCLSGNSGASVSNDIRIYTKEGASVYDHYFFMSPYAGQAAVAYNSDNFWLPKTSDNKIYLAHSLAMSTANTSCKFYVTGYR